MNIQALVKIAREAGTIQLKYFNKNSSILLKTNRDILHQADTAANDYLLTALRELSGSIPIISEETLDKNNMQSKNCFIIDPLDGTINFSRGHEEFGVSIAYCENGAVVAGVVYKPVTKTLYTAVKTEGSFKNDRRLQVAITPKLYESIVAVDPARDESVIPYYLNSILNKCRTFRSYGCTVQALGYLAEGKIDAYIYNKTKIWDVAAMNLIIEEAGGVVTDHQGNMWKNLNPVLVTHREIQSELLSILSKRHHV